MEHKASQLSDYSFVKLEGQSVRGGTVAIADVRTFLDGIEQAAKHFIATDYPAVSKNDYEITVRLQPGSLTAYLVGLAATTGAAALIAFGASYLKKAGEKLAENDIGEKTTADILKNAVRKMKSTVRIAKHLGGMGQQSFPKARVIDKDTIYIINDDGQELRVARLELETYRSAPKNVFKKLATAVDGSTKLFIGDAGETIGADSVPHITAEDRHVFGAYAKGDGIVFPDWKNGERRILRGRFCRANTNTDTLGFAYEKHTLTSYLNGMKIRQIKDSLFDKEVEIEAVIVRTPKKIDKDDDLKKPKLEIRKIITLGKLDDQNDNISLFDE